MPRDAVQTQLSSAVQTVVHVERDAGRRRVASLSVIRWTGAEVVCDLALDAASGERGPGWDQLAGLTAGRG
jgi:pilus assembly protein CpaF